MKKKIASFTAAIGIAASIASGASAAEVTGTVTNSTYTDLPETPVITAAMLKPATPVIMLTQVTPFYFSPELPPVGWLSPQIVDTTGEVIVDAWGNEWRQVYTWMGKAWVLVPPTVEVVTQ